MGAATELTMSKGEFAAHIGVSPGRVSQYISEGKISRDALVGDGRTARVRVNAAVQQIRGKLDIGQAMGNGLGNRTLSAPAPIAERMPREDAPILDPLPVRDSIEDRIKNEKLRAQQFANRKAAEDEAGRSGRFTETAAVREQLGRVTASMMQSMEAMLPVFATAISAKFSLPQRDVIHLLKQSFRDQREAVSRRHAVAARNLPETIESVVETNEADAA